MIAYNRPAVEAQTASRRFNWALVPLMVVLGLAVLASCSRRPPLYLHYDRHIDVSWPVVHLDLEVFWDYDGGYDWRKEWTYGWDELDERIWGPIGYTDPTEFQVRRYFLDQTPWALHTNVDPHHIDGNEFTTNYRFGYYDILAWNHIRTEHGVQSLVVDEETTLDSVMVFTNMTMKAAHYTPAKFPRAFFQPEELFAGYIRNIAITDNPEDYDYYDELTRTYHKHLKLEMVPVTYIYLTQVRLHNNRGRVAGVSGEANLSGMARGATLNSGLANRDAITVHYDVRFKNDRPIATSGELVDVAGGRLLTFGIPNQNSSRVDRATRSMDHVRHYMDVNFIFNNGLDSTMVFDVTDQVRRRFRGGVITIDLDVDTIPIPRRPGGAGFDAVVEDFIEQDYEFGL